MFTKTKLEGRLEDLTIGAKSINTLCMWLMKHRVHFQAIVRIWFKKLVKATKDRKLIFMYLADDVFQKTNKEYPDYVNEFGDQMNKVLEHLVAMNLDEKTNGMVGRVIQTWREWKIFDEKRQINFEKIWKVGTVDARNPLKRKEKLPSTQHDAIPIKQLKNGDGNQLKMPRNELQSPIILTFPPTERNPELGNTLSQLDFEQVDGLDIFSEDDVTTPSTTPLKCISEINVKCDTTEYIEAEISKCEESEYSTPKYENRDEVQSKSNREPCFVTKLSIEDPMISDSQIERENQEIFLLGKMVSTLEKEKKALEDKVCGQDKELEDIKAKHLASQKKINQLEKKIQQKNLENIKLIMASGIDMNRTANLNKSFIDQRRRIEELEKQLNEAKSAHHVFVTKGHKKVTKAKKDNNQSESSNMEQIHQPENNTIARLQEIARNFRKKLTLEETENNKIMEEKRTLEVALKALKEENEKIKFSNLSGTIAGEKARYVNLIACKERSLSSVKEDGHCERQKGCKPQKSRTSTLSIPNRTFVPNQVFVGGISSNTTESELHQLFSAFGQVKQTEIITDREGVSKNYAFVTFETEEAARVLHFFHSGDETNNIMLNGKNLKIAPAIKKHQFVGGEQYPIPTQVQGSAGTSQTAAVAITNGPHKSETLVPNDVFVCGFSYNTTESELHQLFSAFGKVKQTRIIRDWAGEFKGQYGFVTFETEEEAKRLQQAMANIMLKGKQLNIGPAFKKQQPFGRSYEMGQPLMNGTMHYHNGVPNTYQNGMAMFTAGLDGRPGMLGCNPWLPGAMPSQSLYLSSLKPP